MLMQEEIARITAAQHIVILQADNPDADSLASSLALEEILGEMGKTISLYCGVDIAKHLRYMEGHDRVQKDLPNKYDLAILVDCANSDLLSQLAKTGQMSVLQSKPLLVIDHHASEVAIPFKHEIILDDTVVSTGELIYDIALEAKWDITPLAAKWLVASIMADSLGLTTEATTSKSIRTVAELVDKGANLAELDALRRSGSAKPISIVKYKGQLLQRVEYHLDNQLAMAVIPWSEIEQYSPLYNPSVLILEELRNTEDVRISIILKAYPDGKITGKLRCNYGTTIAGDLAAAFNGGGHPAASGFKTYDWKLEELEKELIKQTRELLEKADETI